MGVQCICVVFLQSPAVSEIATVEMFGAFGAVWVRVLQPTWNFCDVLGNSGMESLSHLEALGIFWGILGWSPTTTWEILGDFGGFWAGVLQTPGKLWAVFEKSGLESYNHLGNFGGLWRLLDWRPTHTWEILIGIAQV